MAKYRVCADVFGSTHVAEYEADSNEAAIEMAWDDVKDDHPELRDACWSAEFADTQEDMAS